jgi:hypothetical protein
MGYHSQDPVCSECPCDAEQRIRDWAVGSAASDNSCDQADDNSYT